MKRILLIFLAVALPLTSTPAAPPPPVPAKNTRVEQDLNYYRRLAVKKNMSPNDRLYILNRLKGKYKGSHEDVMPLLAEIDRWEEAKRTSQTMSTSPKTTPPSETPSDEGIDPAPPDEPAAPSISAPEKERAAATPPGAPPVDPDFRLQAGDLLNIQVAPAKELSRETLLQPDGTLVFPLVGTLPAKGLTLSALERILVQKLQLYVMNPEVRVTIRRFSPDSVFVMGKVTRPGPVAYRSGIRLLAAVAEAEGFAEDADRTNVLVHRGVGADRKTFTIDALTAPSSDDPAGDFQIFPGDIVDVQRGGDTVSILGQVGRPGSYPHHDGWTLLELLSQAGGLTQGAKAGRVYIYRQKEAGREPMRVNLARIMKGHPEDDIPLQRGDIVMVPEKTLYAGAGAASTLLTPWFYLATLVIAIVVATKD